MLKRLSLNQIMRYGYGGFLLVGILAVLEPERVEPAIKAAGIVVAPMIIFALGTAIFVIHRHIFGQYVFYQLTHFLQWLLDRDNSPTVFVAKLNIRFGLRRRAYTACRRSDVLFSKEDREAMDLSHTEAHILYLTANISGVVGILLFFTDPRWGTALALFVIGVVTLVGAVILDFNLLQDEGRLLHQCDETKVQQVLNDHGYTCAASGKG